MASRCKTCDAAIIWVKTPAGKTMPLDAKTTTWWLIDGGGAGEAVTTAKPVAVRQSHFATCPQADQHRKGDDDAD